MLQKRARIQFGMFACLLFHTFILPAEYVEVGGIYEKRNPRYPSGFKVDVQKTSLILPDDQPNGTGFMLEFE